MSRLDKIIAVLLVGAVAAIAWLLSRSVEVAAFAAAGAALVLTMLLHPEALQTAPARQVLPRREGSVSPALGLFALIVKLALVFTVPAAFVGWFGQALPERFREFAKLAVLVSVLLLPLQRIFARLLALPR